jgi:AbiV family abortive infection protein
MVMKTRDRHLANQPDISPRDVEKLLVLYGACVQNAEDLLNESVLLAKYEKYHRATFLAITAYEEMGKAQLLPITRTTRFPPTNSRELSATIRSKLPI